MAVREGEKGSVVRRINVPETVYGSVRGIMTGIDSKEELEISDARYADPGRSILRQRTARIGQWFLLDANRWLITGLLLGGTFVGTLLVGLFGPVSVQRFLTQGTSPGTVLVELLKTIVSIVVISLSINQLVLSPELGSVSDQRRRLEESLELRRETRETTDRHVSPLAPAQFLRIQMENVAEKSTALREVVAENDDEDLRSDVNDYAEGVTDEARRLATTLSSTRFEKFEAIPTVMRFGISGKSRRANRIRNEYRMALSVAERRAFDDLGDAFERFATTREYMKTVYIQSEYINFSRALLYLGLPSLLATYYATQIYDPTVFPGATLGISNRLWFVSGAVTVSLIPFALLVAYVSRLATLSQSTLFVGPFVAGGPHGKAPED